MRVDRLRSLRGDIWSEHLRRELAGSDLTPYDWVARNTLALKSDEHSCVGLVQLSGRLCYLKCYRAKSHLQGLLFRSGYGRALRSFDAAQRLRAHQVPVPAPLACLSYPGYLLLLTEGLAGGRDLKALWLGQEAVDSPVRGDWLRGAAQSLARLHLAGFAHGDCKWSNLLWSDGEFSLVDLEAVSSSRAGGTGVLRDLARFTLNAEDLAVPQASYEVFVTEYLRRTGSPREALFESVLPMLDRLRARHREKYGERGHPLL